MKRNWSKIDCPLCGMTLVDLNEGDPDVAENEHAYWCDECDIDIAIIDNKDEDA
jgi:hypothetical protein